MSKQETFSSNNYGIIQEVDFSEALSDRYLSYALSTIISRSLPDLRDGLKPVHRRLLYAMYLLKLDPKSGFKKCARVVGDVIGRFHPHGDVAVYDAMVRLAQDFSVRYPLVDGQGNFGNIDGDSAAAMRYTEARLTDAALMLLGGLEEDAVDFKFTYDGEDKEPFVLPAQYPNILANGATGIAVGMATNIPPHNVIELCEGCLLLIKNKHATLEKLLEVVKGPDFPTGGIVLESKESILKSYSSGKGSFRVRANYEIEKKPDGSYLIVINEIPFMVQKSKLVEKIAQLMDEKKLTMVGDIYDESTETIRLVIEPKSDNIKPELLMEHLFRNTDLENKFNMNLNVLEDGVRPKVMGLKEILVSFNNYRRDVIVRQSKHRLDKINIRLQVLEAMLKVFLNLDRVIEIIRYEDEPKAILISEFMLNDLQAEAILNTRLRSLRKLEEEQINAENSALNAEKDALINLLSNEDLQLKKVAADLKNTVSIFKKNEEASRRKTIMMNEWEALEVNDDSFVEKEALTIILTKQGWTKAVKGHNINLSEIKLRDNDEISYTVNGYNTDKIIIFDSKGRSYTLSVDKIPVGRLVNGQPIRILLEFTASAEPIAFVIYEEDVRYLVASSGAKGFIVESSNLFSSNKSGKQVMTVDDGEEVIRFFRLNSDLDYVVSVADNRKMLVFSLEELPIMSKGKGVQVQKFKDGRLSDIIAIKLEDGLRWINDRGQESSVVNLTPWIGKRAGTGRMIPVLFPRKNKFD